MIIVGLSGNIGSGKTTFAGYLSENVKSSAHWESWQVIAEVATALRREHTKHPSSTDIAAINIWLAGLPRILEKVTHKEVDFEQIKLTSQRLKDVPENYTKLLEYLDLMQQEPDLQSQTITEDTKPTFRSILQWLGGYLEKTSTGIWYDEIVRRIEERPNLTLATVGGVRFPVDAQRIKAAGGFILEINRPDIAAQDQQDLTERERNSIVADSVIVNNGSLDQLQKCARQVLQDLQVKRLDASYTTRGV